MQKQKKRLKVAYKTEDIQGIAELAVPCVTYMQRTWVEISKQALENNITQYKKTIGNAILAPVIKANAYGHGLKEIGEICQENEKVGYLCVATLDEAITLRKHNITKPLLVLSYIGTNPVQAITQNISVTVHDKTILHTLHNIGKKIRKKCKVHIKIDTGLSRLGIPSHKALDFIVYAQSLSYIKIEGIWTHFAESQIAERTFTNLQIKKFYDLIEKLKHRGIEIPLIHISNSAGTTLKPKYENFFRIGLGIYGYWPSDYTKKITQETFAGFVLQPVLSWKTRICDIKQLPARSFVGYMRTYQVQKDSKIAILPIGYFDGYDRRLTNNAYVWINKQYAKVVGYIGMNIISVDITDLENINIGDEVLLVGDKTNIRASEFTIEQLNTREITTKIHPEIPRIIVD